MNVWAIADLHLSIARPERRERYAARWRDHAARIEEQWWQTVQPVDLVLIPGDLSMARNHKDLQPDFDWLDSLPGTKVLSPGNHDSWWNGVKQIRPLLRQSLRAVDGDALEVAGAIVCGAKGVSPHSREGLTPQRQSVVDHEIGKLERSLELGARLRTSLEQPLYLLWHFPPFDSYGAPAPWVARFEAANVSVCVYGHLHMQKQWSQAIQGNLRGVRYYCVAADAIGFRPLCIDRS
jgi:predicted phosphohydrolase